MENYEEIIDALKAGETLINEDEVNKLKLKNGALYNIGCGMVDNWSFSCPDEWQIYKEPKWYENIPEGGVLCSCWDDDDDKSTLAVTEYHKGDGGYCFRNSWCGFKNATPLTKAEIQTFMDSAPQ